MKRKSDTALFKGKSLELLKTLRRAQAGALAVAVKLPKYLSSLALLVTGFALGALMLAFVLAGDIYDYKDTDAGSLPPVDAIVCLAGGRGRISAASELWYRYLDRILESSSREDSQATLPLLYFSGLGHQARWSLVTRQLSRRVLQVVRSEDVMIENESSNTDENAKWLLRIAQERQWKRIVLVTSSYHMKRASFIFAHVLKAGGGALQIDTVSVTQEPFTSKHWRSGFWGIRVTLQEYLKWVYYKTLWTSN